MSTPFDGRSDDSAGWSRPADEPASATAHTSSATATATAAPADDVLAGGSRRGGRGKWIGIGAGLAALAVVGAGTAIAVNALRGGGAQPEDLIPAAAIAYFDVDLDPSAGQKIDARGFLRKFPQLKDRIGEGSDLKKVFFEEALKDSDSKLDYERDIAPWLGDRLGIGVLAPKGAGEQPEVVGALQVKDEDAAREGLRKLNESDDRNEDAGYVLRDGYAIIAKNQGDAQRLADAAAQANLGDAESFRGDMERLGDTGIGTLWMDATKARTIISDLAAAAPGGATLPKAQLDQIQGRYAFTVRFEGDDLEVVGQGVDLPAVPKTAPGGGTGIAQLPDSSVAAVAFVGGADYLRDGWTRLLDAAKSSGADIEAQLGQLEQQFRVSLPEDLAVLLGDGFALALDKQGLDSGDIAVGARIRTDQDKAESVLDNLERILREQGTAVPIARDRIDGGIVLASSEAYADKLVAGGRLGESEQFKAALPEVDGADVAVWADVDSLVDALPASAWDGEDDRTAREVMRVIDGVGLTATVDADARASEFRMKVVTR